MTTETERDASIDRAFDIHSERIERLERIIQSLVGMLIKHGVILAASPLYTEIEDDILAISSEHQSTRDEGH